LSHKLNISQTFKILFLIRVCFGVVREVVVVAGSWWCNTKKMFYFSNIS